MGDQTDDGLAEENAQTNANGRAHNTEDGGLAHNRLKELGGRNAEAPQDPKQRSPLHHTEGDGVVDQKHSDDQSQQTERLKIELKRCGHLLDGILLGFGRFDYNPRRKVLLNLF